MENKNVDLSTIKNLDKQQLLEILNNYPQWGEYKDNESFINTTGIEMLMEMISKFEVEKYLYSFKLVSELPPLITTALEFKETNIEKFLKVIIGKTKEEIIEFLKLNNQGTLQITFDEIGESKLLMYFKDRILGVEKHILVRWKTHRIDEITKVKKADWFETKFTGKITSIKEEAKFLRERDLIIKGFEDFYIVFEKLKELYSTSFEQRFYWNSRHRIDSGFFLLLTSFDEFKEAFNKIYEHSIQNKNLLSPKEIFDILENQLNKENHFIFNYIDYSIKKWKGINIIANDIKIKHFTLSNYKIFLEFIEKKDEKNRKIIEILQKEKLI